MSASQQEKTVRVSGVAIGSGLPSRNSGNDARLHVIQMNAGSILPNLVEFRSRMALIHPDIAIIQEDWLPEEHPYKVPGYFW
jgi:hypothetical protein